MHTNTPLRENKKFFKFNLYQAVFLIFKISAPNFIASFLIFK